MWRIRNELDFLIVKNAMLGVRDAIAAQISVLVVLDYFLYPYVPGLYLLLWSALHFIMYVFRLGINSFYQKLNNSKEHYQIATLLLRFYTIGLALTSLLWGAAFAFIDYTPDALHFIFYMIVFGFTFASVISIGPVLSMYFAYTLPMNIAALVYLFLHEERLYLFVAVLSIIGFLYSLRGSRFFYSIYHSVIEERLRTKKALEKVKQQECDQAQYLQTIEKMDLGIIVTDTSGTIVKTNAPVRRWFGEIENVSYGEFLKQNDCQQEQNGSKNCITAKNGKTFEIISNPIDTPNQNKGYLFLLKDITDEIKNQQIIQKMAQRYKERAEIDSLTQVLNRENFMQQLEILSYEADRTFSKIALLFLDLDDFKSINDTYGHKAGDTLLKIVAKRIQNSIRESDLIGRYAGDEFIIALKRIEKKEVVEKIVTQILYTLSQPIALEDKDGHKQDIYVTVSIGIALYPDDSKDLQQLVNKADRAMYIVKAEHKNGFQFYNEKAS